jgi:cytidylate kinase
MKKITIAIDGFSSTGKSTVAKQLAKALGYVYVDSGAMYRAVTLFAMQHQMISKDHFDVKRLVSDLDTLKITFKYNDTLGFAEVYLNGINVENDIRTLEVSQSVSQVAEISEVRRMLVLQQQRMGEEKGVVMDGRDIGTVVVPDAELKVFMIASAETRAKRRHNELLERNEKVSFDDVLKNVESRDMIDSSRKDSPLLKAENAIEIDNSNLSLTTQFEKLYALAQNAIEHS